MKSLVIISLLLAQVAFSQEVKVAEEKVKSKTGCIDINDEQAILKLKSKQQLALLALRKEKLQFEQAISLSCYKKYENIDLSAVSSKLDVNVVFNNSAEHKYNNDLHLNLDTSKNLNDFKVKFDLAECITKKFNSKKSITKDMHILPPVCSKISFMNEKSLELRKPASAKAPAVAPKYKIINTHSKPVK
jgi:hypothetical protein